MPLNYLDTDGLALYDEKIKAYIATANHSHANKTLLDAYTQTESDLADAVLKRHIHTNKSLIDTYTQTEANLADAVSKKHAHANKTTLDAIEQPYTTAEKTKLGQIDSSLLGVTADQIGIVKGLKKNGTAITLVDGIGDIIVPTALSELSNTATDPYALKSYVDDEVQEVRAVAEGKKKSVVYEDIGAMVDDLYDKQDLSVGDVIYLRDLDIPDFWVMSVETNQVYPLASNLLSNAGFISAINAAPVQVGYVKLSKLETTKVDLSNYVTKSGSKVLTDVNFSSTDKSNLDANTTARHTHSNKSVLDGITATLISSWNGKQAAMTAITNAEINALFV